METFELGIKMKCSKCGTELHIDEDPIFKTSARISAQTMKGRNLEENLGVYITELMIEPCKKCIEEITGPAQKVIDALSAMNPVKKD